MITLIIFLLVLTALVFVHELGHFLAARYFGIRVDEFAIGFPPRIWGKKWGKTEYVINALPMGGYVKIYGENPDDVTSPDNILSKPRWQQVIVLVMGVTFNVIFAWLLLSLALMVGTKTSTDGFPPSYISNPSIVLNYVNADSPAQLAGLKPGDELINVSNASTILASTSLTVANVQQLIATSPTSVSLTYIRGEDPAASVKIEPSENVVANKKAIGISMSEVGTVQTGFFGAFYYGVKQTFYLTLNVVIGLFTFFKDIFIGHPNFNEVAGPVGIAGIVGQASRIGFSSLVTIMAVISVNLAVINLLPFPALDGGRVVVVTIEAIRRKQLSPKWINILNIAGFVFLIALMLIVTFKDILKLFK